MKQFVRGWMLAIAVVLALTACVNAKKLTDRQREEAANYNLQLAMNAFGQGNFALAKERIEQALKQDPNNAQTHVMAGLLFDRIGHNKKANKYFSQAVSLEPKNPDILNNYAVFLCRKGDRDKGEKLALSVAHDTLYRTPEMAWLNAGQCALRAEDTQRAEQYFRQALLVKPDFAEALLRMANLEFGQANYLSARGFLQRYMQAVPVNAMALWLGVRIEQALGNQGMSTDYARRLKSDFPTAKETKELLSAEQQLNR